MKDDFSVSKDGKYLIPNLRDTYSLSQTSLLMNPFPVVLAPAAVLGDELGWMKRDPWNGLLALRHPCLSLALNLEDPNDACPTNLINSRP